MSNLVGNSERRFSHATTQSEDIEFLTLKQTKDTSNVCLFSTIIFEAFYYVPLNNFQTVWETLPPHSLVLINTRVIMIVHVSLRMRKPTNWVSNQV